MLTVQFSQFPVLETNRLRLRMMTEADAAELFWLRTSDQVMQYIGRPKPKNLEEAAVWIKRIRTDFEQSAGISWGITQKETDLVIGTIGFWRMEKENHRAEIGYLLHPGFWGKGIASEAMQAVLSYGFNIIKFHSVQANVDPRNLASQHLLKRNGFVQEAHFRESYYFEGEFIDSVIFCMLCHEYH